LGQVSLQMDLGTVPRVLLGHANRLKFNANLHIVFLKGYNK